MLKKIRSLTYRYAIPAAFIVYVLSDILILGLGSILSLLPQTLPIKYLVQTILMLVPAAIVVFFGFSCAFKKGKFFRGLLCGLPFIVIELISFVVFFAENIGNPEANWKPWYLIVYGLFTIVGVGVREECIYRATIQNIVAKKHANSVKGIWITVIIGALIFGVTHITNIFFDMDPRAVFAQMASAFFMGLMFGAIYMRSGSLWAIILIHILVDVAPLSRSTFLYIESMQVMNQISWSWKSIIYYLIVIGIVAFLLRPSKCKQICESLCFADKESESDTRA